MANFDDPEAVDSPSKLLADAIDPRGQAALLVVEALMHVLIEKSMIGPDDAVDALQSAISVEQEIAARGDESAEVAKASLALLDRIVRTFETMMPDDELAPSTAH